MGDDAVDSDKDESMDDSDDNDSSPPSSLPRRGKGRSSSVYPVKNVRKTPKKTQISLASPFPEVEASCKKPPPRIDLPEGVLDTGRHLHHGFKWLHENRRDSKMRTPQDPEYDRRTVHVPPNFLKEQTPAMKQWWGFKSTNMDTVLFFKVGKFYELFHMDADVGMQELDLIYMKGEKAHSGFPEISYGKFAEQLVTKGYRVARVEQTETPEGLKLRNDSAMKGRKDKVVRRELCSVLSRGTRTYCFLDPVCNAPNGAPSSFSPIVAITERLLPSSPVKTLNQKEHEEGGGDMEEEVITDDNLAEQIPPAAICVYGVCIVDSTTSMFMLGQFEDGKDRNRLRTLLTQYSPAELLYTESEATCALSEDTLHLIKSLVPNAQLEALHPKEEFWGTEQTVEELQKGRYFSTNMEEWPPILRAATSGRDDSSLCISALGAATWYLRRALIEHDLLSMGNFTAYIPPDKDITTEECTSSSAMNTLSTSDSQFMVLDGVALANLEVLRNSFDGGSKGSLWNHMNRCKTAFGRRLLHSWITKPLVRREAIDSRLDAVQLLLGELSPEAGELRSQLSKLPDIERLLSRVHSMSSSHRSNDHPDSRAIMYECDKYEARKLKDFCLVLDGLEMASKLTKMFEDVDLSSASLLEWCLRNEDADGAFPNLSEPLNWFGEKFDAAKIKCNKTIKPLPGVDPDYDDAKARIVAIETELEAYFQDQRKVLRCSGVQWYQGAKDKWQLEVPENVTVPKDYNITSKKKGFRRYWTDFITNQLREINDAEADIERSEKDQMRLMFARFDKYRSKWAKATECLAHIDALLSLAEVSSLPEYCRPHMCRYEENNLGSFIELKGARHPCLVQTFQGGEFIPNDIGLGSGGDGNKKNYRVLLLTGPNMGGKSTLLRQTCLIAIIAQIGCFVPCESARLTPFDRIFTRIGASDRILAGQSTFYVELSETASILHHATARSLVILDELGRGTSTFDGTAIAHAVVKDLIHPLHCLAMFATHYHSLVKEWEGHSDVETGHMGCRVEGIDDQKVTFLYKLAKGPCPKSFGINVASLAQLPPSILDVAKHKSQEFEQAMEARGLSPPPLALENGSKAPTSSMATIEVWKKVLKVLNAPGISDKDLGKSILQYWNEIQSTT